MNAVITDQQISAFATAIARELDRFVAIGESTDIQVNFDIDEERWFTAEVSYRCKIGKDRGTPWAPPSWWREEESTEITSVTDSDGRECPDLICALEFFLN